MPKPTDRPAPTEQPALTDALVRLAAALELRAAGDSNAPTYLDMAVIADDLSTKLHELARALIAHSRDREGHSWADVGGAFGVTRQAAMRRWTTDS